MRDDGHARSRSLSGLVRGTLIVAATIVAMSGLAACNQSKRDSLGPSSDAQTSPGATRQVSKPLPKFEVLAARYNERVRGLESLRTPVGLIIDAEDQDGKSQREQVEGNLSLVQPRYVVMRLDKIGQTLFQLGSNPEHYWWIDLSGEEKVALVGTHAKARSDTAARFGVPVHPLDLIELLAITPLETEGARPGMRWSPDGKQIILTVPGRWAGRRLWITPENGQATRVELLNMRGDVEVRARLEKYQIAAIRGDTITQPRIATKLFIEVPRNRVNVELNIVEPENPGDRVRMTAFDLERQKDNLGVERVVDLDTPPEPAVKPVQTPEQKPDQKPTTSPATSPPKGPASAPAAVPATSPAAKPATTPATVAPSQPSTQPSSTPLKPPSGPKKQATPTSPSPVPRPAPAGASGSAQPARPSELPTPRERLPGVRP